MVLSLLRTRKMANKARGTFLRGLRPLYNESAETTNQDSTANQKDDTDTATFNDSDSPDGARAVDGAGGGGEGEEPVAAKGAKPKNYFPSSEELRESDASNANVSMTHSPTGR